MVRRLWKTLALLGALCLASAADAQQAPRPPGQPQPQQQRDMFQGRFGVMEVALPAREALRQAEMLNATLSGLAPQRPGVTDVYVLAAAFWGDPVFESEASNGAQILASRLGAEGRVVILTNGAGAAERRYPAADPSNLQVAVARLGQVIDPAEDLVVIFLTSHGAADGSMSILEPNRLAGALRPGHLRTTLQDSGIRNRVVIISSCYAGAFVAPLMDERTIVFTAASSTRTSFGCQPTRDWTYFGDAFLNQQVRNGAGLVAGFDAALRTISQWEQEQRLTPSQPQKFVGAAAAQMLARVEAR